MTTDKNFRMTKQSKRMVALMGGTDAHQRGHLKRMLIQGQVAEEAARRAALKSKDKKSFADTE